MEEDRLIVKLDAEVIANYTNYKDMSRYAHVAIYADDELSDVLVVSLEDGDGI